MGLYGSTNYHKVNEVLHFDAYLVPDPRVLDWLGTVRFFFTTLDSRVTGRFCCLLFPKRKKKNDRLYSVRFLPICQTFIWLFWGPSHLPPLHGLTAMSVGSLLE